MGQKNSKKNKEEFNIPINMKLSTDISRALVIKSSPDDISRFKRIMNNKLNKEFTPSQFSDKFNQGNRGVKHIASLLSLIHAKNTNTYLKQKSNRTLYESVFNYNIIEKDSKGYEEFNKNIICQMGLFINGEQSVNKDNAFIPQLTTFKQEDYNDNDNENNQDFDCNKDHSKQNSSNNEDPFQDKNSSHIKKTNTANDTDNENIIKKIQEIKESQHEGSNDYNNDNKKNAYNNQKSLKENMPFNPSANESYRLTEGGEDRKRGSPGIDNQSVNLHFDRETTTNNTIILKGKPSKASSPSTRVSKANNNNNKKNGHRKDPKKQPLVNIKINLKDLIKQDVYETSSLVPKERFKATMERRNKSRSRTPSPDNLNDNKQFNDSVNNLTTIKASDISQVNINDGSFLDLVDALAQPNLKEEKRIHSRTPKKRTTTYENENQKSKLKNSEYIKMFNVTNRKTNVA